MKKQSIIGLILFLLMSTSAFAYDTEINGLRYDWVSYYNASRTSGDVKLVGYSSSYLSESLTIPCSVKWNERKKGTEGRNCQVCKVESNAFENCTILKSVDFGCVQSVMSNAFKNCSSLQTITFSNTIISILPLSFSGCSSLSEIHIEKKTPPNIYDENAFDEIVYRDCKIIVPEGSVDSYKNADVWKKFANITDGTIHQDYTLTITASGNGSASYNGTTIRGKTSSFTVNEGTSATITFSPDNGYRIKSVKVNNSTVSVSNNQYTISSINANTTVSVEFEAIPVTTYTLSITASGSGSASYSGSTIRGKTSTFTVNAGTSATITFSPDNGYRIKSVKVNNTTVSVSNNQYTISSINANTTVSVEFEAIPVTTYTLSITARGNGSALYGNETIRSMTSSFTVNQGLLAKIIFYPDYGYRIRSLKVNGSTVTVTSNQYTISNVSKNTTVDVEFEAIPVTTHILSITASGNGSASYSGTTVRSKTNSFTVNEGTSATITFSPDNGYRIKSVKVNNSFVSVSNNQYTISSINANTTISVEFEAIPTTTYTAATNYKPAGQVNPISGCVFCADPTAIEYNGRLYVYGSNDHQQFIKNGKKGDNGYGDIKSLVVFSTDDMVNWTFHGTIDVEKLCSSWTGNPWYKGFMNSWAPSVTWRTTQDGKEEFFLYFANSSHGVGVLKAESPIGPWTSPLSESMINRDTPGALPCNWIFDPGVVIGENGTGWISFGGGDPNENGNDLQPNNARIAKLKPSMIELDGSAVKIPAPYHFEASELNIMDGKFVYTYCSNWANRKDADWNKYKQEQGISVSKPETCTMCYMVSDNPTDPNSWKYKGVYGPHPGSSPNNHSHLHKYQGNYYHIFHNGSLLQGMKDNNGVDANASTYRSICVAKATVDEATQTINKVDLNNPGVTPIKPLDPYQLQQSETMASCGGVNYEDFKNIKTITSKNTLGNDASENMYIKMVPGSWTAVRNVDFGENGAKTFVLRAKGSGTLEIRTGRDGQPIATMEFSSTTMEDHVFEISPEIFKGTKNLLFFVFTQAENVQFDAWQFSKSEATPVTTYTLSITASGNGSVTYNGTTIRGKSSSFTVNDGSSATITFIPDNGYRIKSVKVNGSTVTASNNQYTISSIKANTTLSVEFEAITYTLSVTASGSGSASYNGTTVRSNTSSFTLNAGSSVTITFSPDNGYRIKSVKVNNTTVSVSNNQYTIGSISANTTISVEFEAIPPTTYTLSISASGNGSASYGGTTIRSKTSSFTVNQGSSATITFTPDNGYRIKSVKVNNSTVSVSNNQYTISSINGNTTVSVEFEAITYTLSITALGNGSASYGGTTIRSKTSSFTVNSGSSATITFTPDNGYRIKSVKLNSSDVTSYVSNNSYTISNITKNSSLDVEFAEELKTFTSGGINYSVSSYDDKTIIVGGGNYGRVLEVPAEITYQDIKWKVIGIDNAALADNTELAAIIWNPAAMFTISVSNPNLLLYVTSANYAPSSITNVIVNNTASKIVLSDAVSGNDFYCPKEFTAKSISYTHNYLMMTGIGESRGWETIVLPFDVQKITHSSKGEIIPFANWNSGDSKKPFWLMAYGTGGWTNASSIKANTPYIISMPNHTDYKTEFRMNGNITFSAANVTVKKSDNILTGSYDGKTFIPSYANINNDSYYALNVNSDYVTYYGEYSEGSRFILGLRAVRPFEAYMMSSSSAARSIAISGDMPTGVENIALLIDESKVIKVYNLKGQLVIAETGQGLDEVKKRLPAGVYIVNGKKQIIK